MGFQNLNFIIFHTNSCDFSLRHLNFLLNELHRAQWALYLFKGRKIFTVPREHQLINRKGFTSLAIT